MSENQPVADLGRKFCSVFDAISTLLKIAFQRKKIKSSERHGDRNDVITIATQEIIVFLARAERTLDFAQRY